RVIGINSLILVDNPEIGYAIPMFKVHSTLSKWAKDAKIDIEEGETQISFDEKTLTEFIQGYYSLIPYTLNDPEIDYYLSYVQMGSEAANAIPQFIDTLLEDSRTYDKIDETIEKDAKIDIEEGETQISFDEKTLTEYIQGYYSLIPYTLNDPEIDYYLSYVQMGSEAANAIPQFIDTLLEDSRTYDKIDETIENVTIGESEAKIDVHVRMLYHQTEDDEVYEVVYNVQHVIIIDEYGDYKISKSIIQE